MLFSLTSVAVTHRLYSRMRSICQLGVLLVLVPLVFGHQARTHPAKRKSITPPPGTVDYDANRQTVLLNISFSHHGYSTGGNNYKIDVLRYYRTESADCGSFRCGQRPSEAVVIQSRRICFESFESNSLIRCDETVLATDQEWMALTLRHIFTGCYCFRLATYRDDSIRTGRQLLDRPRFFRTDVTEYDVFKWNLTLDLSATSQTDLRLFIRPEEEADFDGYHVELFRHEVKDVDLLSCHETDDPMNEHLTIDSSVQWMTFRNRSDGYYCVLVIPEDDRCHPTSVDLDRTCARHSNLIHIKGPPKVIMTYHTQPSFTIRDPIGVAVLILVVLSVTLFILIVCKNVGSQSVVYQHVADAIAPPVTFKGEIPVLLFYSRADRRFIRHVSRFKRSIQHSLPDCRIFDDEDDAESLVTEGIEWFANRIAEPDIRIVMVMCQNMIRCQQWLMFRQDDGEHRHRIDPVCSMRLDQLTWNWPTFGNEYNRIFAVYLDDDYGHGNQIGPNSVSWLTPYRSYRWPTDRRAFLDDLRHSN